MIWGLNIFQVLLVLILCIFILLLLVFLYFILSIVILINYIFFRNPIINVVFFNLDNSNVVRKFVNIKFNMGKVRISSRLSYLTRRKYNRNYPTVICIHGTASHSISFLPIEKNLSKFYNFYALDLPGFGESTTDFHSTNSNKTSIKFYNKCLLEFQKHLGLKKIILIGHSFGGFVSINYALKFRNRIEKLVLISPAGLMPTLGEYGAYYGLLFKIGFPYTICKIFGKNFLYGLLDIIQAQPELYHWVDLYCKSSVFANKIIASYISILPKGLYWNLPVWNKVLKLNCPVHFIYGEYDNLTPSHQGVVICNLNQTKDKLYIIPNYSHNPISGISKALLKQILSTKIQTRQSNTKLQITNTDLFSNRFLSNFDKNHTNNTINYYYKYIEYMLYSI